jgi:hypothetical protein
MGICRQVMGMQARTRTVTGMVYLRARYYSPLPDIFSPKILGREIITDHYHSIDV